ncbi:ABC transporter ATP-binding protein [Synechococcus sp. PCC 7336]|uniref:ABC transporter ATP-binding protein n=1 Tax=Synechococcus sp. PCC 7336 TaxID=195250 RepID=UPI000347AC48|nr:ABC transporter ATP-binding protein [Synechococcus sp. PCC 7336]
MLQLCNVTKRYGDRSVLKALSLQVRPGEIYGLLGPNGSGKTTTINIICNLLQLDSGWVLLDGQRVSDATKALVGIAPQDNLLYRSLTCAENLDFFARIYGLPTAQRRQRIRACLEAVKLGDRAHSTVETLSGGMQRRLSIAIALVHQPKLVILDEPTTGLDIEARYDIWHLIQQLERNGTTVLLTTHLLDEAERLCHRIGILKQGHILAEGSLEELRQHIRASELAIVETPAPDRAIARADQLGWAHRYYGGDLAFWLPEALDLPQILSHFEGIPLTSVARQPVRLEHIYLEVTQPGIAPTVEAREAIAIAWEQLLPDGLML